MVDKRYILKFYADKKNSYSNKFFCFEVKKVDEIGRLLYRFFQSGNVFRGVWITDLEKEVNTRQTSSDIELLISIGKNESDMRELDKKYQI